MGIYMTIESNVFSLSVLDIFKYLKMFGKECFISYALFYGGIVLMIVGQHIDSE